MKTRKLTLLSLLSAIALTIFMPTALAVADNAVFLRAGDTLFRMTGGGKQISHTAVSHDTLAILPESGNEVMVCTPAYAYRLEADDFTRE